MFVIYYFFFYLCRYGELYSEVDFSFFGLVCLCGYFG